MNINNVIKKQTTVIALTVIGICIGLLGISYAIFFKVNDSTNNQTVSSGSLVVQFGEGSKITTEMLPQTDEEGMATTGYSFSVTNKGSLDMLYDIFIYNDPDASNATNNIMLPHQYIKVSLDGSDPVLLSELEDSGVSITSDSNYSDYNLTGENNIKKIIGKDIFVRAAGSGKDINTHIIKLWITEDAPTSIIGNTVALEIQVFGEADTYVAPPTVVEKINELYTSSNPELVVDDYENIRYIGADPANYIYFNCDDYSNPTAETCEKWRIIGSFKDIEDSEGTVTERVKIMRDELIGDMAWEISSGGSGGSSGGSTSTIRYNDWSTVSLNTYLNGEYYNSLKNDTTKNLIDSVIWNLGGSSTYNDVTAQMFYERERGTTVYGSNQTTWTGKIALIYPSDYGYATSGGSTTNRDTCLNTALYFWFEVDDCLSNNYINVNDQQWTLTQSLFNDDRVFEVAGNGQVSEDFTYARLGVRPVLYLDTDIQIISGDGTSESPYVLYQEPKPLTVTEKVNELYAGNNPELVVDDYDNIRYIGADPANYIYFNCDDYNNPSAETCEKWRIIGSFKDIEDSEGQTAERVKIMRDESIGNIAWDSNGINNWATATLNTYLNGDYLNGDDYNSLKNDITKNMIDSVVWNLGGAPTYTSASNGLAKHFYIYERGTSVYGSNYSPTWTGKIALMYPSDYGYATSGGSTTNREACLNKELSSWDSVSDCYNNDYIFDSSNAQWTLTHDSYDSYYAFGVHRLGSANSGGADSDCSVRPVLYLESSAVIASGDGSEASPYVLGA